MKDLTLQFCRLALENAAAVTNAQRADLYEFAAVLLSDDGLNQHANAARRLAADLRNADAAQTHFDALFFCAPELNKVH